MLVDEEESQMRGKPYVGSIPITSQVTVVSLGLPSDQCVTYVRSFSCLLGDTYLKHKYNSKIRKIFPSNMHLTSEIFVEYMTESSNKTFNLITFEITIVAYLSSKRNIHDIL